MIEQPRARRRRAAARAFFAATTALVVVGLVLQWPVLTGLVDQRFSSPAERVIAVFSYFTVDANLAAGLATGLLALRPNHPTLGLRVLRLTGLACVTITAVVYHAVIAGRVHFHGLNAVGDQLLHTVVPVMSIVGWLAFGPRGLVSWREAVLALIGPAGWLAVVLLHGAAVGWYPYPFIDAADLGYRRAVVNIGLLMALFLTTVAAVTMLDQWLTHRAARGRSAW
jgi:hypothetical protein